MDSRVSICTCKFSMAHYFSVNNVTEGNTSNLLALASKWSGISKLKSKDLDKLMYSCNRYTSHLIGKTCLKHLIKI